MHCTLCLPHTHTQARAHTHRTTSHAAAASSPSTRPYRLGTAGIPLLVDLDLSRQLVLEVLREQLLQLLEGAPAATPSDPALGPAQPGSGLLQAVGMQSDAEVVAMLMADASVGLTGGSAAMVAGTPDPETAAAGAMPGLPDTAEHEQDAAAAGSAVPTQPDGKAGAAAAAAGGHDHGDDSRSVEPRPKQPGTGALLAMSAEASGEGAAFGGPSQTGPVAGSSVAVSRQVSAVSSRHSSVMPVPQQQARRPQQEELAAMRMQLALLEAQDGGAAGQSMAAAVMSAAAAVESAAQSWMRRWVCIIIVPAGCDLVACNERGRPVACNQRDGPTAFCTMACHVTTGRRPLAGAIGLTRGLVRCSDRRPVLARCSALRRCAHSGCAGLKNDRGLCQHALPSPPQHVSCTRTIWHTGLGRW